MSSIDNDLKVVPRSLSAKSPEELTTKMLANNIADAMTYVYYHIQFDGKSWVAWFLKDASDLIRERFTIATTNNDKR